MDVFFQKWQWNSLISREVRDGTVAGAVAVGLCRASYALQVHAARETTTERLRGLGAYLYPLPTHNAANWRPIEVATICERFPSPGLHARAQIQDSYEPSR